MEHSIECQESNKVKNRNCFTCMEDIFGQQIVMGKAIGNYQKMVYFIRTFADKVHDGSCRELGLKAKELLKEIGEWR